MSHIIWTMSYGPYHMDHIVWTIPYDVYFGEVEDENVERSFGVVLGHLRLSLL